MSVSQWGHQVWHRLRQISHLMLQLWGSLLLQQTWHLLRQQFHLQQQLWCCCSFFVCLGCCGLECLGCWKCLIVFGARVWDLQSFLSRLSINFLVSFSSMFFSIFVFQAPAHIGSTIATAIAPAEELDISLSYDHSRCQCAYMPHTDGLEPVCSMLCPFEV